MGDERDVKVVVLTADTMEVSHRGSRCNAKPISYISVSEARVRAGVDPESFVEDDMTAAEQLLTKVFASGGRVDGQAGVYAVNEDEIMQSLAEGDKKYAEAVDEHGWTAVLACAMNGFTAMLKTLVEVGGADPLAQTTFGMDAFQLSQRRGHHAITSYLKPLFKAKHEAERAEAQAKINAAAAAAAEQEAAAAESK